jgi:hypothetical protein
MCEGLGGLNGLCLGVNKLGKAAYTELLACGISIMTLWEEWKH